MEINEPTVVVPQSPEVMPSAKLMDPESFERFVRKRQQMLQIDREAKRRLDAEEHPPQAPPLLVTLKERLARPPAADAWRSSTGCRSTRA